MDSDAWFDEHFATTRVMIILRGLGAAASLDVARRAWAVGIRAVEVPLQSPSDVQALTALATEAAQRGLVVGAGTIIDPAQVAVAARAGAAYTVSPGTSEAVIRASLAAGLPTLPGVATASEIQRCLHLGLSWLKVFPASVLGPAWLPAMRGPFPGLRLVATGGIDASNGPAFLAAGARVLAAGSAAEDPVQLARLGELAPREGLT